MLDVAFEALLVPFMLVLCRLTGVALGLPYFAPEAVPVMGRVVLVLALALALSLAAPTYVIPTSWGAASMALIFEALLGLAIGFGVRLSLVGIEVAAEILGIQIGFGFDHTMNPLLPEQSTLVTRIMTAITGLVFLMAGGFHAVIRGLAEGLTAMPAGSIGLERLGLDEIFYRAEAFFVSGARIAAPIAAVLLATHLSLALLSKIAPQLNLWAIGFIASVGVGLACLYVAAPTLLAEVQHAVDGAVSLATLGGE